MAGRTSWWAHDSAWHRRGRQKRLGREFGPAGPNVLSIIHSLAKEQESADTEAGEVMHDLFALDEEAYVNDEALTRRIVERAGELGALDDLRIDDSGRFWCRVSGWADEQFTAAETQRKREQRAAKKAAEQAKDTTGQAGTTPDTPVLVPVSPTTPQDTTPQDKGVSGGGGDAREWLSATELMDLVEVVSNALVFNGAFERGDVQVHERSISDALAEAKPPTMTDWDAIGRRIAEGRRSNKIRSSLPAAALRFVFNSFDPFPQIGEVKPQGRRQTAQEKRSDLTTYYASKAMDGLAGKSGGGDLIEGEVIG